MDNSIKRFTEIAEAGRMIGRAIPPLRFATDEEADAWREDIYHKICATFAPAEDEEYDVVYTTGTRIAERFTELYTFSCYVLNSIRRIVGDYETYEAYEASLGDIGFEIEGDEEDDA